MTRRFTFTAALVATGCVDFSTDSIPCRTNANCPTGYGCTDQGACEKGVNGVAGVKVSIIPSQATVEVGARQKFDARVDGAPATVAWLAEGGGTIDPDGTYTAPTEVPNPNEVTIRATTQTRPSVSATAVAFVIVKFENPTPVVLSLNPASVRVGSGALTLTVDGGNFSPSSQVHWNGTPLTTTSVSQTRLTAAVLAPSLQAAGTAGVTVVNPGPGGGTSNAQTFSVLNPAPAIQTLSPTSVSAGSPGFTLTVTGSDFVAGSEVFLDATKLATTFSSAVELKATVTATVVASGVVYAVTVQTPGPGGGTTAAATLTVTNPPATLASFSPQNALAGSGPLALTLEGVNFVPGAVVGFAGQTAVATFKSATQFEATVPASFLAKWGTATVTVRNPPPVGGSANSLTFRIDPVVRTAAGGYTGDGGPAIDAAFTRIERMAMSTTGEVYLAEPDRNRIIKIDTSGNVKVVAGGGVRGFAGDGGPATTAVLNGPRALAFDSSGNLYFSDYHNFRIRKIDSAGTISTVAGNGTCGNAGNGGPPSAATIAYVNDMKVGPSGALYITSVACAGGVVRKISGSLITSFAGTGAVGSTGDGGLATLATFYSPVSLAIDPTEQVYIGDWDGHRVRKVNTAGVISAFAGTGFDASSGDGGAATAAATGRPQGLALDAAGNLYIAQFYHYRIRRVDASTGLISTYAGNGQFGALTGDGGPATTARIGHPAGMLFGAGGSLLFLTVQAFESNANMVKKVDSSGTLSTFAGGKPYGNPVATQMSLYRPLGVAVDVQGNLFVSDSQNDRIWKVTTTGAVSAVVGTGVRGLQGDGGPALLANTVQPEGVWIDNSGNLYYAEITNPPRIRKVDASGTITTVAGGAFYQGEYPAGCPAGSPTSPPSGAGPGYNCVGDDYLATAAVLVYPRYLVGDNAGNLYVAEFEPNAGNRIRKVNLASGRITTLAGSTNVATTTAGFSGDGGPATAARLSAPAGMAIDPRGDLVLADCFNNRIRRINVVSAPLGVIDTIAGTGAATSTGNGSAAVAAAIYNPFGIAYDAPGNLYLAEPITQQIRRIDTAGIIDRFAGAGVAGFSGDNGAARIGSFYFPVHIAVSLDSQRIYVGDALNDRVRVVGP